MKLGWILRTALLLVSGNFALGNEAAVVTSSHSMVRDRGAVPRVIVTIEIFNGTKEAITLPTRNIGPLVTFTDHEVLFEFEYIPKLRDGGGIYVESLTDFAPVTLFPGERLKIVGDAEIFQEGKITTLRVLYDTSSKLLERFRFAVLKSETISRER